MVCILFFTVQPHSGFITMDLLKLSSAAPSHEGCLSLCDLCPSIATISSHRCERAKAKLQWQKTTTDNDTEPVVSNTSENKMRGPCLHMYTQYHTSFQWLNTRTFILATMPVTFLHILLVLMDDELRFCFPVNICASGMQGWNISHMWTHRIINLVLVTLCSSFWVQG